MSVQILDQNLVIAFWLMFCRMLAVLLQLPIFEGMEIPATLKALFCAVISFAFFDDLSPAVLGDINAAGASAFWLLTIFNLCIGLVIGYIVKSIMYVYIAAGSVITQQIGFGAVRYFDPSSSQQVGPFEKLIQWTMVVLVISSGALIPMFKGMYTSFFTVTFANMGKMAATPVFFLEFFKGIFLSALMLSSPLIFANIIIMSVLGIIARTVPQMNILMVSFVLNIGLGLVVFAACSDEFFQVAFKIYTEKLGDWFSLVT